MQLFIQSPTGETITLNGCACVDDVIRQVSVRVGIRRDMQVLSVHGRPLPMDQNPMLCDVGVESMSTIQLSVRLAGGHATSDHDVRSDDYYKVLGVDRRSSEGDIAKAYRVLALKYHPDRNPGSSTAEENFKRVSAAYDTLKDASKRAHYDRFGKDAPSHGQPTARHPFCNPSATHTSHHSSHERFTFSDASDLFRQFFGHSDPFVEFERSLHEGIHSGHSHVQMRRGRPPSAGRRPRAQDTADGDGGLQGMVRVGGLVRNSAHNGRVGHVVRRDPETHRVVVRMVSSNEVLAFKSQNLTPLVESVVCGLQTRAELNGKTAYISERATDGRYVVFIPPLQTPIAVQLARLRLANRTAVRLHGLANAKYNGARGCIVDAAMDGSSYTVEIAAKSLLRVKNAHIHVELLG